MIILLIFAFLSGLVTIFAPCICPILPIILSSATTGGKKKPLGITLGIMVSFAVFTLTISYIVKIIPFDPTILRYIAVIVIGFLGLSLVIPKLSQILEGYASRLSSKVGSVKSSGSGFGSGFLTGVALGVVWTPCAGPILATIATLAATQAVNFQIVLVTIFYVIGVGIPLYIFTLIGQAFFTKSRFVSKYTGRIQQIFGVIMILTALSIATNYDKTLQARLLDAFPSYSRFIIGLENVDPVKNELDKLRDPDMEDKIDMPFPKARDSAKLPVIAKAPEFVGISKWLNTDTPLDLASLRGKVVLIDFWTYTCINCIRTLPYIVSWYDKYKDDGFVVVGVHTPEFEFEKKAENVEMAIDQFKIKYPVAQDNDYATWRAYDNHYWPAKYLIDKDGNIRYFHFGEGEYETTEKAIQELLNEAGSEIEKEMTTVTDETPRFPLTPETYLGIGRADRFHSTEELELGVKNYSYSKVLNTHEFAFWGSWKVFEEYSEAQENAAMHIRFEANKVFLVIHPTSENQKVAVYLDNKLVDAEAGKDVSDGYVLITEPKLYELIDLKGNPGNHILELKFDDGVQIFAFTFG